MRRALVLALVLVACRQQDPIERELSAIAEAAEARDVGEVMQHLAPDYQGNRAEVEASLRRYFFAYKSIDVTLLDRQTQMSGDEAWSTFRVNFLGVPKTLGGMDQYLPRTASYRFEVLMREEAGGWKVVSARWEELSSR